MLRKCFLHCIKNLHNPIPLPHLEETTIGRSQDTQITDPNCSRKQLSIKADCEMCQVWVKQLGVNASGINGFTILKNESIPVDDGAYIELLLEKHVHMIKFDPPKNIIINDLTGTEIRNSLKRKVSIEEQEVINKKMKTSLKKRDNHPDNEHLELQIQQNPNIDSLNVNPTTEESLDKIDNGLLYILTTKGVVSKSKIASYDLDGTLIKTRSGLVFAKNIDDWQLAFSEVPGKLKHYHASGYKVVIFTNQAQIGNGKMKIEDFKTKLQNIIRRIGVPVQAFISTGKGIYRKPSTGMLDTLSQMKNDDIEIDMSSSFYCGDAAGRKKDHSLADRLYAENISLTFHTPENHFTGTPEAFYNKPIFDPRQLDKNETNTNLIATKQEILVMVGFPGSGKSYLAKLIAKESKGKYRSVCRDNLGSWQRCAAEAAKILKGGDSVVVDSTNPDAESRARWISLAATNAIPCRCVQLDVSHHHSLHNNRFRQLTDTSHTFVADMVFHTYKKKFQEPSLSEGFAEIKKAKFIPQFDNEDQEKLYFKHLLEK